MGSDAIRPSESPPNCALNGKWRAARLFWNTVGLPKMTKILVARQVNDPGAPLPLIFFDFFSQFFDQRLSLSLTFYQRAVLRYKLTSWDTLEVSWKRLQRRQSGNPIRLPSWNAAAMWIRDRGLLATRATFCGSQVQRRCQFALRWIPITRISLATRIT